jgi:hypothetical protein
LADQFLGPRRRVNPMPNVLNMTSCLPRLVTDTPPHFLLSAVALY